jgi:hypothetical protein
VVAQVPARELGRGLERRVRVADLVVRLVARAQALQDLHRVLERRLLDRDLLEPPEERAVLLDVLELLEGGGPDDPDRPLAQDRLDHVREVHGPAGGRPRADHGVELVDEQDRLGLLGERGHQGLEALLEVAPEARAREERAAVEAEDLRALQDLGDVLLEEPLGQALDESGLAHPGLAHEHRVVLPAAAEDLERALELGPASDQGVELALPRRLREVDRVGGERVARGTAGLVAFARGGRGLGHALRRRHLGHAVRDEVQDVEAGHPLHGQELRRVRFRLLEERGQDVADVRLLAARGLDVHDRGREHAPEGLGLLGLVLAALGEALDRVLEVLLELGAQPREVDAAGAQDLLALGVVGHRVEQVLQREVRMAAGDRLAIGDLEDELQGRAEHPCYSCSRLARRGNPFRRASSWTCATFVSATSYG